MTVALDRPQSAAVRVHGVAPALPERPYSGIATRTVAFAIDAALIDLAAALVGVVVVLVLSILSVSGDTRTVLAAIGGVAFVIWSIAYFTTFWTTTGQTPGNRVMQIRVERLDGSPLRPRHALVRLVGMVVSLPLLWGYLPILFNDRRRAFYDALAGTVVVTFTEGAADGPVH
jgi:uncharacterized RDD family membrane protein YckC